MAAIPYTGQKPSTSGDRTSAGSPNTSSKRLYLSRVTMDLEQNMSDGFRFFLDDQVFNT